MLLLLDAKVSFCAADRHWVVGQIDWSALAHQKDLNSICLWWLQFPGWTKSPHSSLALSFPLRCDPPSLSPSIPSSLKSCHLISLLNGGGPCPVTFVCLSSLTLLIWTLAKSYSTERLVFKTPVVSGFSQNRIIYSVLPNDIQSNVFFQRLLVARSFSGLQMKDASGCSMIHLFRVSTDKSKDMHKYINNLKSVPDRWQALSFSCCYSRQHSVCCSMEGHQRLDKFKTCFTKLIFFHSISQEQRPNLLLPPYSSNTL